MRSPTIGYAALLFRRLWKFLAAYAAVYLVAVFGFYELETPRPGLLNSFYWAMVTIATVGYGDIVPTTANAKIFTLGIIATEVFLSAYLVSVVLGVVSEEAQHRALGTLGTNFSGHIVVLGYGGVGRAAVRELLVAEEKVAIVTEKADEVSYIRSLAPEHQLFVTVGPPADLEILKRVNIPAAHSVVVCSPDDTVNLVAALNVRSIAPKIRIVVSVARPELKATLKTAGVTYVASPQDMGGRLCADAAFRPDVANAVEDLTEASFAADMTEYLLTDRTPVSTQTLPDAETLVRRQTDCLVIGYARPDGEGEFKTVLNPPSTFRFQPGDAILLIGSLENLRRFHRWFGTHQGR
ncbi:MAG: NAD-binding protein [Thermoplasmata archaeon]|nr:NAD-binding protein [Thermoplasmata archaeon]